jgi:hypothetical protein
VGEGSGASDMQPWIRGLTKLWDEDGERFFDMPVSRRTVVCWV